MLMVVQDVVDNSFVDIMINDIIKSLSINLGWIEYYDFHFSINDGFYFSVLVEMYVL